ncbi:MAG: flagellar biosynthetic protein FliO [Pontiellaceae bacterium]|nr:flagellar biosynthetic protein FliO [Pontiellaceae bacterium]MBN2784093.1 flagellar biosynthetic protein FliO [Pontiellaceae bacterium]
MDTNSIGMGQDGLLVIRMLTSLILVLGAMAGIYFWLKRRGGVPGSGQRRMRVIERLAVDSRRSILLLQVDDEEIVVGVGNDGMSRIKTLSPKGESDA